MASKVAKGVGALTGITAQTVKEAPISSALLGAGLAVPVAGFGGEIVESMSGAPYRRTREAVLQGRRANRVFERERREIERLKAENLARLARVRPDVYNRVMAGMDLPDEATVIGGRPRTDLADMLAEAMAGGRVGELGEIEGG